MDFAFCLVADELVKELNSVDVATQMKAVKKADCLVASLEKEKTGKSHVNRTVINPNPLCVVNKTIFIHLYIPMRSNIILTEINYNVRVLSMHPSIHRCMYTYSGLNKYRTPIIKFILY